MAAGAVFLALAGSAACDGGPAVPGTTPAGTTQGGTTPAGTTQGGTTPAGDELIVRRTGGIAGVDQRVTVQSNGAWTYTDRRGTTERGTLPPSELDRLRQLVSDPRLAAEAARPTPGGCADAFVYELSVGDLAARYTDCPAGTDFPVTSEIIALLTDATPL